MVDVLDGRRLAEACRADTSARSVGCASCMLGVVRAAGYVLVLWFAWGVSACGCSAPRSMYCARTRHMPAEEYPLFLECWDEVSHCRPNSTFPAECDAVRTVRAWGFHEERLVAYGGWVPSERWFASEAECRRAHDEPPNGTRARTECEAR